MLRAERQTVIRFIAKLFVAMVLLLAFLQSVAPLNVWRVSASQEFCALDCCLNLPAHSSGACHGGACHSKSERRTNSVKKSPLNDEVFCGAEEREEKIRFKAAKAATRLFTLDKSNVLIYDASDEEKADSQNNLPSSLTAQSFSKPCRPDCGAASFNFSSQNRTVAKSSAVFLSALPRPPTIEKAAYYQKQQIFVSSLFRRETQSRAPPSL